MKTHKILTLVGGISKGSINQKLYRALKKAAPEGVEFSDFDISTLPFFSQDIENDPPPSVVDLKSKIEAADGILFITPEYNRSIPGVLKNAIDWASRPYGKSVWKDKKALIMGISPGKAGTTSAQLHLRTILMNLGILVMPKEIYLIQSETLSETGDFASDKTKDFIVKNIKYLSDFI
ncbi:MAG: NADPH-dependent FMN reductase [Bdellovibrionota bacterium]